MEVLTSFLKDEIQLGITITEITATVLSQEAVEADSIKMLSKKLDKFMDPRSIKKIPKGIDRIISSINLNTTSMDTGKYKENGLKEKPRLCCSLRCCPLCPLSEYLARCTSGLIQ